MSTHRLLLFDADRCLGCRSCELACAEAPAARGGVEPPPAVESSGLAVYEAGPFARERKRAPLAWAERLGVKPDRPLADWPRPTYERLLAELGERMAGQLSGSSSPAVREYLAGFQSETPCPDCHGSRLKPENEGKDHDPGYRCWPTFFAPGQR